MLKVKTLRPSSGSLNTTTYFQTDSNKVSFLKHHLSKVLCLSVIPLNLKDLPIYDYIKYISPNRAGMAQKDLLVEDWPPQVQTVLILESDIDKQVEQEFIALKESEKNLVEEDPQTDDFSQQSVNSDTDTDTDSDNVVSIDNGNNDNTPDAA